MNGKFANLVNLVAHRRLRSTISVPGPSDCMADGMADRKSEKMVIKIAQGPLELATAYRLLHSSYVDAGLMRPEVLKMRVTKYHLLPTTTVIIAQRDERTIGTLSIVQEGAFGLPIDRYFHRSTQFPQAQRIAEILDLAVARDFRQAPYRGLFPVIKFMISYLRV